MWSQVERLIVIQRLSVKMEVNQEQIEKVGLLLNNKERPLKERFRALFTLRSISGKLVSTASSES